MILQNPDEEIFHDLIPTYRIPLDTDDLQGVFQRGGHKRFLDFKGLNDTA